MNIHIFNKSPFCFDGTMGKVSKSSPIPFHVIEYSWTAVWYAIICRASDSEVDLQGARNLSATLTRCAIRRDASWTSCECLVQFSSHRLTSSSCSGLDWDWPLEFTRRLRETALGYCVVILTPDQTATSPRCWGPVGPRLRCFSRLRAGASTGGSPGPGASTPLDRRATVNVGWLDTPGGFFRLQ